MKKWYLWLSVVMLIGIGSVILYNQGTFAGATLCGQEPCPLLPSCCK